MGQRGPATCCLRQAPGDFQTVESLAQFQSHTRCGLLSTRYGLGTIPFIYVPFCLILAERGWGQSLPAKCQ